MNFQSSETLCMIHPWPRVNAFIFPVIAWNKKSSSRVLSAVLTLVLSNISPLVYGGPEFLIKLLYSSSPIVPLIECFEVALSSLQSNISGGEMVNDGGVVFSTSSSSVYENPRVGEKRPQDSMETCKEKLQKFEGEFVGFGMKCEGI
nr:serine/threonine-protein kinase ATR [Ipomoea batatas]